LWNKENMYRQVFTNRWLAWAIVAIVVTGVSLCAVIWRANIEADTENLDNILVLKHQQVVEGLAPSEFVVSEVEPVEGWQTYRNEKYGYEFKYPRNLVVKETMDGDFVFVKQDESPFYSPFELATEGMGEETSMMSFDEAVTFLAKVRCERYPFL